MPLTVTSVTSQGPAVAVSNCFLIYAISNSEIPSVIDRRSSRLLVNKEFNDLPGKDHRKKEWNRKAEEHLYTVSPLLSFPNLSCILLAGFRDLSSVRARTPPTHVPIRSAHRRIKAIALTIINARLRARLNPTTSSTGESALSPAVFCRRSDSATVESRPRVSRTTQPVVVV